jgi:hypothetical protein
MFYHNKNGNDNDNNNLSSWVKLRFSENLKKKILAQSAYVEIDCAYKCGAHLTR